MAERFAGRYELVDVLGSGGMGTVWRVWDEREREFRAAKVLRQADATSLLRFVREQGVRISCPHVLAPLGWAAEDDRVLFTMEIISGGSLSTLIGDFGALPPAWAALFLDQLLTALDGVHRHGLVHRDVKPANLLLRPTGKGVPDLLLGDFGVALPIGAPRLTRDSIVMGTPGYYAPEQLAGADPDPRQDLYSAGMVAVEMLTGKRPEPTPGKPLLSPAAAEVGALGPVIGRLIARDPANRFQSAGQARAALASTGLVPPPGEVPYDGGLDIEILDQCPPLPNGDGTVSSGGKSTLLDRLGRRRVGALAAVCLLSASGVAAATVRSGDDTPSFADPTPDLIAAPALNEEADPGLPPPETTTTSAQVTTTSSPAAPKAPGGTAAPTAPPRKGQTTTVPGQTQRPPQSTTPTSPPVSAQPLPAPNTNLTSNGEFENGTAGWFSSTGATVTPIADGHDSVGAVRITNPLGEPKTSVLNDQTNSVLAAPAPGTYLATVWVRTETPGVSSDLRLMQWSKALGQIKEANAPLFLQDTAWHQLSVRLDAAGAGYDVDLNVLAFKLEPGKSLDIDGLTLVRL